MRLSVVIPALDEQAQIERTVERARDELRPLRIVVVDGGSSDATAERALTAGAVVLEHRGARGTALNDGAALAEGDALVFLHADTLLAPGSGVELRQALDDPAVSGGAFRLRFDQRGAG